MRALLENYLRFIYSPDSLFVEPRTFWGASVAENAKLNLKYGYYTMKKVNEIIMHTEVLLMGGDYVGAYLRIYDAVKLIDGNYNDPELIFRISTKIGLIHIKLNTDSLVLLKTINDMNIFYEGTFPDWIIENNILTIAAIRAYDFGVKEDDLDNKNDLYRACIISSAAVFNYYKDKKNQLDLGVTLLLGYCFLKMDRNNKSTQDYVRNLLSYAFSYMDDLIEKSDICKGFKEEFDIDYYNLMQ